MALSHIERLNYCYSQHNNLTMATMHVCWGDYAIYMVVLHVAVEFVPVLPFIRPRPMQIINFYMK